MAFAMVLCPVNPEIFGVLLYSFWWAALWPVIILGWKRDLWWARIPLLVVGALSSPAGAAMVVPFAVSWWWSRRRAGAGRRRDSGRRSRRAAGVRARQRPARHGLDLGRPRCSSKRRSRSVSSLRPGSSRRVEVGRLGACGHCRRRGVDRGRRRVLACRPSDRAAAPPPSGRPLHRPELRPVAARDEPRRDGPRYYFLPFVSLAWLLLNLLLNDASRARRTCSQASFWSQPRSASSRTSRGRGHDDRAARLAARARTMRRQHQGSGRASPSTPTARRGDLWTLRMTPAECRARL